MAEAPCQELALFVSKATIETLQRNENYGSQERVRAPRDRNNGASSHTSNLVQGFLKDTLKRRFIAKDAWPPSSPDTNPLDYWFWDAVKLKVYEGRAGRPFDSEQELKNKIKRVWSSVASDKKTIRKAIKQFVPRLPEVARRGGYSIKMTFG